MLVADSLNLSVSNRQLNRQPATSCQLPIRWTYIVRFESESATSCQLSIHWTCLYLIGNWIGIRQLVASCRRWTYIVRFESESATGKLPVADSLNLSVSNRRLNRQPASSCRWILNRQPATSCQLPIRWTYIVSFGSESATGNQLPIHRTCLYRIGNWIGNRQLVASIGNWIGNRQLVASCRFVELVLSVSNLNRQPATSCQLPIRWTCLYWIGNWIGNRQLVASCRFVEIILCVSNRQLNRQPATESATGYLGPYIVSFESATESATGNWIGNRQPTANFNVLNRQQATGNWIGNRQPATHC